MTGRPNEPITPSPLAFERIVPITPYGFFLQWTLTTAKEAGDYVFHLYRSGSAVGPWEAVAGPLPNQYAYVDRLPPPADSGGADLYRRANQLALMRQFYYRLRVVTPNGTVLEAVDDTEPPLGRLHAQQWRRATFDTNLALRKQGLRAAVVKRRRWGRRCLKCTDAKTREIVRANCPESWGTPIEGGYWDPVLVYARHAPSDNASTDTPEQRSDASYTRIWLPYAPSVEKDDLIVFVDENRRFLVDKQVRTEIGARTVHQVATAVELNHDHLLYRFPIDVASATPLV